jgi:hypothetical protein
MQRVTVGGNAELMNTYYTNSPAWLKLTRVGNEFTFYRSSDGMSWESIGTLKLAMNANVYVGLAHMSGSSSLLGAAAFDNVAFEGAWATATPPTQPPTGTAVVYQAESMTLGGGTVANRANMGYTGSGYADFGGAGSSAQFTVTQAAAGTATIGIRYANGSTANRPYNLLVNGVNVGQFLAAPTGGGNVWKTDLLTNVSLNSGANTIRLVAVGAGADLDQVTVTSTTTTPPPPLDPPVTLQAEAATLAGGTVVNAANKGYAGSGYADFGGAGSSAQFAVTRTAAGTASLTIRYANGSTANRPYNVMVNGSNVGQFLAAPTGGGNVWKTDLLTNVSLNSGANTIRLVAVGAGADLDQLTVTPTGTTPPPPPADPALLTLEGEAAAFGNGTVAGAGNKGYLGTGYADFGGAGSYAQFTVTRIAATSGATVGIRYANGSAANRPFTLIVNGVAVGTLACPPTGSGSTWATLSLANVALVAGSNTIRLVAVGAGADLDQLTIATA